MTASLPVLSSLTSRLAQARLLARGWLSQLWTERPELIERLLCQAFDLDPGGQSPGTLLRQLARGGASGFETALSTTLPGLFEAAGALAAPPRLVGKPVALDDLFPGLTAPAGEPAVLGADRIVEDRFSGFTAGWSGNGSGAGDLLINRAWAEHATVLDLAEMLLEQAGHALQELLGLPEPRGDEGRIFAEGVLRLAAGLGGDGANPVVPEGTVEALRLRDDGGYLFNGAPGAAPLRGLELGELSDQFFERLTRLLANGEVPLLDLSGSAAAAVRASFGFSASGLIDATPSVQRDSYASRLVDGSRVYARDEQVLLSASQIDAGADLLRLVPAGSAGFAALPGSWDLNDFGFALDEGQRTTLSQPLVLDLRRTAAGAQAPVTMRRANGTLVVGPGMAPPRLYAVPFWSAASPGVLQGYKLFDSASDAVALFRALTASAPTQASIDAAAEAALRLEAGAGSDAGADRLVLNADRLYGLWGWQPETIRDHLEIEAFYGLTAEAQRLGAGDRFGETSASGFFATHAVLQGTGALSPTGVSLPAAADGFWLAASVRPTSSYPIVAFQGTDNLEGALDDANPAGVGIVQYLTNVGQIMADLTAWSLPGLADGSVAPISFTGNSLGAALAQQFTLTALDPLGTLGGIEANLLSGPLSTLSTALTNLAAQPITDSNWLGLLAGGLNLALLSELVSGDGAADGAAPSNEPSLSEKLASLGGDLVDSLAGYGQALAHLSAAALDGSAVLDGVGLPVYRLVALHAPGIQDCQFEALSQPWDSQVIADVAFQLSLGDVVGLAGDLHLPGEVTFRGFDPLSSNPQLPSDLDALLSGFANLHSNLAYHPVGLTALTGLAEGAGEQLIHLVDNQQPLELQALPAPGPDSRGLQRFGVAPSSGGAVMAGFGGGNGNFDDSGDLNWLLHRQQVLHVAALVDDFLGLLRELMAPPSAGSSATGGGTAAPGVTAGGSTSRSLSLVLGAFQITSSQLRLDDPGLRAHIGAGRLLTFTLSPGTRLPRLAEGSAVPRGWNEGRPQELFLRPSSPGSNLFDIYASVNVAGQPVGRLRLSADQETVVHAQQDINNLYQSGAFQLPAAERAEIDRIVAAIAAGNQTVRAVRISSSTDPEPLTPSLRTKLLNLGYEGSNRGLAVARAEAMRSYLLERLDTLPGLDQSQLQLLLPPVPRLPVANAGERRYSDATYTLAWEQGASPRDPAARFVRADLDLERRLAGGGTLHTSWTTPGSGSSSGSGGSGAGGDNGLSLDLGDLLCRFTASYGVEDLRLLFGLLFRDSEQGNAADAPFWEGASGEALAAGLLLWGYDNL
ncbi:MAG: hypothetical protein ACK550_04365, partial [Synechococcaceae cyanobacterium]